MTERVNRERHHASVPLKREPVLLARSDGAMSSASPADHRHWELTALPERHLALPPLLVPLTSRTPAVAYAVHNGLLHPPLA